MNKNDMGIFLLCLFVFIILFSISIFIIYRAMRGYEQEIKSGKDDSLIEKEFLKQQAKEKTKKRTKTRYIVNSAFDIVLDVILVLLIGIVIYFNFTGNNKIGNIPQIKTVESSSMAVKNEKNTYLFENDLNDQFTVSDLIVLKKLPKLEDIKIYDIILYKRGDGLLVLHRVEKIIHASDGRILFQFHGDSVPVPDQNLVEYSQMLGIYSGIKIPVLGNMIRFVKSGAGFLCIGLCVLVLIIYPYLDNRIIKLENERLVKMGYELPQKEKKKPKPKKKNKS